MDREATCSGVAPFRRESRAEWNDFGGQDWTRPLSSSRAISSGDLGGGGVAGLTSDFERGFLRGDGFTGREGESATVDGAGDSLGVSSSGCGVFVESGSIDSDLRFLDASRRFMRLVSII